MNLFRSIAIFLLLLTILPTIALATPRPAHAEGLWYLPTDQEFAEKVKNSPQNEIFGERYTFAQVVWIIKSIFLYINPFFALTPADIIDILKSLLNLSYTRPPTIQEYAQLGLPGILAGTIADTIYYRPASGIEDISRTLAKFSPVSPAQAQTEGFGFRSLNSVSILWSAFRNMSYLIMTILLIAAGFIVMFRVKINPQTAVTIQLMIPKIILSLLLVTFSYAIAGLVIDLVYLIISFIVAGLSASGAFDPALLPNALKFFTSPEYSTLIGYFIGPLAVNTITMGVLTTAISVLSVGLGTFLTGPATLINLILFIVFCWMLFKIWWMLIKTYLTLIFTIIIGPLQIMLGLLPSAQQGFGTWFRNLTANASVFAVVPIMILFSMFFWRPNNIPILRDALNLIYGVVGATTNPIGTNPAGVSGPLPKLPYVNTEGDMFNFFVGLAILALIPKTTEIIRDALKIPPFKYGAAFGEAISPVSSPAKGVYSAVTGGVKGAIGEVVKGFIP